jgi:hypothetical protein
MGNNFRLTSCGSTEVTVREGGHVFAIAQKPVVR